MMFILYNFTVLVCILLLLFAVLSSFSDIFMKRIKTKNICAKENLKPVSVVIISDNNAQELKENLALYLSQDYSAGYEVIVAICKDEDGTRDVLESFSEYKNLYSTFVPTSSKYVSIYKLAITLGVKAAKNELILLTDASCKPITDKWIYSMTSACDESKDMVLGYSNYNKDTSPFRIFTHLYREYVMMYEVSKNRAYGYDGKNVMFRKSLFLSNDGFLGNLKYLRGEYDFLINKYAKDEKVTVNLSSECFLSEISPTNKEWHKKNLFYMETRKHLADRFMHRFICNMDCVSLYVGAIASITAMIYGAMFSCWLMFTIAVVTLLVPIFIRLYNVSHVIKLFNVDIPLLKIISYEFFMFFHNLKYVILYFFSDKYEFISHKN